MTLGDWRSCVVVFGMTEYAEEASRVPELLSFRPVDGLEEESSRVEELSVCLGLRLGEKMSPFYLE